MDEADVTKAEISLQELGSETLPDSLELPFSLLSKRENKSTKLVATSNDVMPMKGVNRWFDYEFLEPVFLSEIIVEVEDYNAYNKFEFKWYLAGGSEVAQDLSRSEDDSYRAPINQLVNKVSFKPPSKWLSDPKINRVRLIGFKKDEIENFVRLVSKIDRYKASVIAECNKAMISAKAAMQKIDELSDKENSILESIDEQKKFENEINSKIGRMTEERKVLIEDINIRKESIKKLEDQSSLIDEQIAKRQSERNGLGAKITEQQQNLSALQSDINMFPTELSGFTAQGAQNAKTYWVLATVPLSLLVVVTALLVLNAANLTTVFDEENNVKIWSILITRLPYVLISTAIITVAYKLAKICITEIIKINQQRLNLSKISIIATDVSASAEDGLDDLSSEQLYDLRTKMKMQLLRDHLKEYISQNPLSSRSISIPNIKEVLCSKQKESVVENKIEKEE